jgi:hypothetical protein
MYLFCLRLTEAHFMRAKRSPRQPKTQPLCRKVTMSLPRDLAKRLCLLAVDRETTLGALAAPALRAMLAGSHFVDLARQAPLAIAELPEIPAAEAEMKAS